MTVRQVLDEVPDIGFVHFDGHDVVRHKLVQRIVTAYREHDERSEAAREQRRAASGAAPEQA